MWQSLCDHFSFFSVNYKSRPSTKRGKEWCRNFEEKGDVNNSSGEGGK